MGADFKKAKSRLEVIQVYTSLFLGALCIVGVLGLSTLFLYPKQQPYPFEQAQEVDKARITRDPLEAFAEVFLLSTDDYRSWYLDKYHDSNGISENNFSTDQDLDSIGVRDFNNAEPFFNGNSENNLVASRDLDSIGAKDLDGHDYWSKDSHPHGWTKDTTTFLIQVLLSLYIIKDVIYVSRACKKPITSSGDANLFEMLASQINIRQVSWLKLAMTHRITMLIRFLRLNANWICLLITFLKLNVTSMYHYNTIIPEPEISTEDWKPTVCRLRDMGRMSRKLEPCFDLVRDTGKDYTASASSIQVHKK